MKFTIAFWSSLVISNVYTVADNAMFAVIWLGVAGLAFAASLLYKD